MPNERLDRVVHRWGDAKIVTPPDAFMAVTALIRLNGHVRRYFDDILQPLDLTRTTFMLLCSVLLAPEGGHKMADLSEELMVRPTTVTLLVDQLAERKLVRRVAHPTDRRANLVTLTASGRALVLRGITIATDHEWGLGKAVQAANLQLELLRALNYFDDPIAEGVV